MNNLLNTTDSGRLGEAKVLSRLVELGWYPFTDISGKCPIDIIAWKDGVVKTLQVKTTSRKTAAGNFIVQIGRIRTNKNTNTIYKFNKEGVDYLAVYICPEDKLYFIPSEKVTTGRMITINESYNIYLALE